MPSGSCSSSTPKPCAQGQGLTLELGISDDSPSPSRRRLVLSTRFTDLKITPLHCQMPIPIRPSSDPCATSAGATTGSLSLNSTMSTAAMCISTPATLTPSPGLSAGSGSASAVAGGTAASNGGWYTLLALLPDLLALAFPAASFKSLDTVSVSLSGACRLRRVFTLRDDPRIAGAEVRSRGGKRGVALLGGWNYDAVGGKMQAQRSGGDEGSKQGRGWGVGEGRDAA